MDAVIPEVFRDDAHVVRAQKAQHQLLGPVPEIRESATPEFVLAGTSTPAGIGR
jgi:hypothetical protein